MRMGYVVFTMKRAVDLDNEEQVKIATNLVLCGAENYSTLDGEDQFVSMVEDPTLTDVDSDVLAELSDDRPHSRRITPSSEFRVICPERFWMEDNVIISRFI